MKQLIAETATWPPGARLALFFFLPAAVALQVLRLLAEVPLYLEYQLTTTLRSYFKIATPPIVGDIGAAISAAGKTTGTATKIVIVFGLVVAAVSIAATNTQDNQALVSLGEFIGRWWSSFSVRADLPA
jgi:hypothetical protein